MSSNKRNKDFHYEKYLQLDDDVIFEVIDGEIHNMSPSPSVKHQKIARELLTEFNLYLREKTVRLYQRLTS